MSDAQPRFFTLEHKTYYESLDLPRSASFEQIFHKFKMLATRHHPVKNPTDARAAREKFVEVCEAFDVLSQSKCNCFLDFF